MTDTLAEIFGTIPVGYRRRCDGCGATLFVKTETGWERFELMVLCAFKTCANDLCPSCRRISSGIGPVGCPCDERGVRGHGRPDEQPKPHVSLKGRR